MNLKTLTESSSNESRDDDDVDMSWLEPFQRQAAKAGASLVYYGQPYDPAGTAKLLLLPTRSWSAILRICGTNGDNYGLSTCDIINRLAEFQSDWPFDLQGCGHDFAAIRFKPIDRHQILHEALLEFCPDLQGDDSTPQDLRDFYLNDGRCFLWWD